MASLALGAQPSCDPIETLTLGVVAGGDDLAGLGDCLNLLERVANADPQTATARQPTLQALEKVINRVILEESADAEADWQRIRALVAELVSAAPSEVPRSEEDAGNDPQATAFEAQATAAATAPAPPGEAAEGIPAGAPASGESPASVAAPEPSEAGQAAEPENAEELADPELLTEFIEEARENLAAIEMNVLTLENDPEDKDAINAVFRPFHSIKGVSGFLNLRDINALSHQVENLLDAARSDRLPVNQALIDVVLQATDVLKGLLQDLENAEDPAHISVSGSPVVRTFLAQLDRFDASSGSGETPHRSVESPPERTAGGTEAGAFQPPATEALDPELLREFIEEARENLASIELNILALESDPEDHEAINAVFRPFHSIKGVSGFLNLTDINRLSHQVENLLDAARGGSLKVTDRLIDIVLKAADILKALLNELEQAADPNPLTAGGSPAVAAILQQIADFDRADRPHYVKANRKVGEILVAQEVVPEHVVTQALEKSLEQQRKIGEVLVAENAAPVHEVSAALRQQRHARESVAFVRVATDKLDNLVDGVGELVIAQSMVLQNERLQAVKDQKLQKDIVQLSRITAELQRISMSMRMVPIKNTFQKLIRLVRDLSKKAGKEIALELFGEDTEIDRNMVEEIYEPLVHMIRNAADHGIEDPETREALGKPRCGTIRLAAEQSAGSIIIDIQDDGQGLDVNRIRQRGIERGIISAQDNLPESALFELIFHPGFSTKEKVTDVSGRGVGMDVVKKTVEQLKGKIEIESTPGKGSRFQLKLPLTMAIIDGMVIKVGEQRYVVPTIALRESLRPARKDYFTVQGSGEMVKVRESLMPLVRLHRLFQVEPRHPDPWEALLLVVTEGDRPFCLLADEIVGRQEVVIKGLGASMKDLVGISGGAILGDGRVALILDVKGIVHLHENLVN